MANPFFNAQYYLAQNADVADAVGTDLELAEQHYFLHGALEADEGTNTARKPAPWFDIEFYRAQDAKLADVPAEQLFLHFTLHGISEGLSPMEGVELDAEAYAAANPELVEALGIENAEELSEDDILLLNQHFYAHGYREGLEGGPSIPGYNPDQPDVDLDELTEALETYQDAVAAREEFLEEAAENEAVAELLEEDDTLSVVDAIEDAVDATVNGLNDGEHGYNFNTVTNNAIPGMIDDVREELEENVAEAEEDAAALKNVLTTLQNRQKSYEAALASEEATTTALTGELAKAAALTADVGTVAERVADVEAEPPVTRAITLTPAGEGAEAKVVAEVADGKVVVRDKDAAAQIKGWDALLASFDADVKAEALVASRGEAFLKGANAVLQKEVDAGLVEEEDLALFEAITDFYTRPADDETTGTITYTAFGEEAAAYLQAQDNLAAFNAAVENYEAVAALATKLAEHDEAVAAAQEAIADLGYEVIDLALEEGADEDDAIEVTGTEGDDLFVFLGNDAAIDLFGEVGDDLLFIGADYSFNSDVENGDASALEVFFTQDGDDVVVTVEQTAFGTNAEEQEINEITLTGVNADDLSFVDGYVVIA